LFSRVPFYHAEEATDAIKPLLGDLYHRDDRSFMGQLWSSFTKCKFVEVDESNPGVLKWAKNVPLKESS
jgi:omega-6 fatty acid desaturase (delta-12 desaturase)